MITYIYGDLFLSPARALVNPVNTAGIMGQGLGQEFKRFYPDMFAHYQSLCQQDKLEIGQIFLYRTPHKWIVNLPVKKHWRAKAQLDYLEAGLRKFVECYGEEGITSVSFPLLGAGELDGDVAVRPLMESYLNPLPISVYIHLDPPPDAPQASERRHVRAIRSWLEGRPVARSFDTFWRDLSRLMGEDRVYHALDAEGTPFRIFADTRKRNRRRNLIIRGASPQPIFIAETTLIELWDYIQRAGYVLPQNLPSGLDQYAPYIFGLLTHLDEIRAVYLSSVGQDRVMGLHYVPPSTREAAPVIRIGEV